MLCHCGSGLDFSNCCEPYIKGEKPAPTAEALMRSRYSAHVTGAIRYLKDTLAPESRKHFDEGAVREWANKSEWVSLKVHDTKKGQPGDATGVIEFVATYRVSGKGIEHHEVSQFRYDKEKQCWFFVDGESHQHAEGQGHGHHHHHEPVAPVVRESPKIGRNDPCPCGSGKKYKKCHGQ